MKQLTIDMEEYQYRLLPCPFCAGESQTLEEIDEEDEWQPPKVVLNCTGCGAQHFAIEDLCGDDPLDEAIEEVIHLWNRRWIAQPGPCPRCGSEEVLRVVETYIGDEGTHHKNVGYCCEGCGRATIPERSEYHALRNWYTGSVA